jgi:hypothetical protein
VPDPIDISPEEIDARFEAAKAHALHQRRVTQRHMKGL